MNPTETTEKKYPFTKQELSELINKLPAVFPSGRVSIPPHDCTVEWDSFYSGDEIFKEIPERDLFKDEDGNTIVDEEYPKRTQNKKVGEGISIRSKSDVDFRIFDPEKLFMPIYDADSTHFLELLVTLIKEFANTQIERYKDDRGDREAAKEPWVKLRDEAISWQSQHDCVEMDVFNELCGESEHEETTQVDDCWLDGRNSKLKYQDKEYRLTPRQYQIIKILKYESQPENGVTTKQLRELFNKSYGKGTLTTKFRIDSTFKNDNIELLGTLINNLAPKPYKYSLSVEIASIN
jgi:hypothetical protein